MSSSIPEGHGSRGICLCLRMSKLNKVALTDSFFLFLYHIRKSFVQVIEQQKQSLDRETRNLPQPSGIRFCTDYWELGRSRLRKFENSQKLKCENFFFPTLRVSCTKSDKCIKGLRLSRRTTRCLPSEDWRATD